MDDQTNRPSAHNIEQGGKEYPIPHQPEEHFPYVEVSKNPFRKPRVPTLFGILIILIVVAGGIFFVQSRSQNPSPSPSPSTTPEATPTPDPTAKGNMYKNDKYSYELQFPSSMKSEVRYSQEYDLVVISGACISIYSGPDGFQKNLETELIPWSYLKEIESLETGKSKVYYSSTLIPELKRPVKITHEKLDDTTIGGYKWSTTSVNNDYEQHSNTTNYFTNINDNLYLINASIGGGCPGNVEGEITADQILTTFKFTE